MRRYQFDYIRALNIAKQLDNETKKKIIKSIGNSKDKLELTSVNFTYQVPISFAVLTHLTRHRMHDVITPDFAPVVNLGEYKVPPKVKSICLDEYNKVFLENKKMYEHFKNDYNIREEDLVYFTLSGNMVNVVTNINGKTLKHILSLRECNKAQWEIREVVKGMHNELKSINEASIYETLLGPSCETDLYCKEGRECCGKIDAILKRELK